MTKHTKPAVFYFSFNLDPDFHDKAEPADPPHQVDEEGNVTYAFAGEVRGDDLEALQRDIDSQADWFEKIFFDCEGEYGVHDWCSGPDSRVLCFGGFDTYEVEPTRVMALVNAWREALLSAPHTDVEFGPAVRVPNGLESDWDVYEAAVDAGSHTGKE